MSTTTTRSSYARGARVAGIGIAATALVTQAYFSLASHQLGRHDYGGISLLWSAIFLVCYLTRVYLTGTHRFPGDGWLKTLYLTILFTHMVLAVATVPRLTIVKATAAVAPAVTRLGAVTDCTCRSGRGFSDSSSTASS